MTIKISRYCVVFFIIISLMFLFAINPSIMAKAEITNTSLKLICKTDEVILSDMEWNLYKISSTKKDDIYQLEGEFAEYNVSLKDLSTTSNMLDIANTLENYAILDKIQPVNSGATDNDGVISFADLEVGLYMLSGKSVIIDNKKYTPSAMLIEVEEDKETAFQLTTYPKFKVKTLSNTQTKYTVRKMWLNDENDLQDRPNDIVVELYMNEELNDTIHLNDENNWEYSWNSTDAVDWRVKEVTIPDNYVVIYRNDEVLYLVVNIHSDDNDNTHNQTNSNSFSGSVTTSVSSDIPPIVSKPTTTVVSAQIVTTVPTPVAPSISKTTTETTVTASSNGSKISSGTSINNTKNNGSNKSETVNKLPQTGQMWFPVPLLTLCGVVSIAIGLQLKSKK